MLSLTNILSYFMIIVSAQWQVLIVSALMEWPHKYISPPLTNTASCSAPVSLSVRVLPDDSVSLV